MRTIFIAALFAGALLSPANAQERVPSSWTLQDYVGQYVLADGRMLSVTQRRHRLVAKVEGQDAVELDPAGPSQFVARQGPLHLTFDQYPNGSVTGVTLDNQAKQ